MNTSDHDCTLLDSIGSAIYKYMCDYRNEHSISNFDEPEDSRIDDLIGELTEECFRVLDWNEENSNE